MATGHVAIAQSAPENDSWSWAEEQQAESWRALTTGLGAGADSQQNQWSVRVVAQDGWSRTAEFVVVQPWKGTASVEYVRTLGENLSGQLHALREYSPEITVADAIRQLKVRRGTLDARGCPALRTLAAKVPKLKVPALPMDYLALHVPGFDVTLAPAYKPERRLVVDAGEDEVAKWCGEVLTTIVKCERPNNEMQRTRPAQATEPRR